MFGCLFIVVSIGAAMAAGLGVMSFWWTLIPTFIAASLAVSNNDAQFARVVEANEQGRLHVMPLYIGSAWATMLVISGVAYGIAMLFS